AAEGYQRRAGQPFANMTDSAGGTGAGVFLEEDHLLFNRRPSAAVLLRPADAGPAAFGQLLLPAFTLFGEHVFVAGAATIAEHLEFAHQIAPQPASHFSAKGFVFRAERQFHLGFLSPATGRRS